MLGRHKQRTRFKKDHERNVHAGVQFLYDALMIGDLRMAKRIFDSLRTRVRHRIDPASRKGTKRIRKWALRVATEWEEKMVREGATVE